MTGSEGVVVVIQLRTASCGIPTAGDSSLTISRIGSIFLGHRLGFAVLLMMEHLGVGGQMTRMQLEKILNQPRYN
jgi:hypothetical protein